MGRVGPENPDAMITFIPGGEAAMGGMYNYEILRDLATSRGGIVINMEVAHAAPILTYS